jgi:hypothetical protein
LLCGAQEDLSLPIAKAAVPQEGKYRYQFFQTQNIVEVAVLAKNLTPDRVDITIEERKLHVIVKSPEGEQEYELSVDLYDAVSPCTSACIFTMHMLPNFWGTESISVIAVS